MLCRIRRGGGVGGERERTLGCLHPIIKAPFPSWGPTLMPLSKPNYLPKSPPPNTIDRWGLWPHIWILGETSIQSTAGISTLEDVVWSYLTLCCDLLTPVPRAHALWHVFESCSSLALTCQKGRKIVCQSGVHLRSCPGRLTGRTSDIRKMGESAES